MKTPLISVVMATFNESPEQITQSIQSILNQTLSDFELLLIDDSTKPETITAIDILAQSDCRIKIIRQSRRIGFVPALNIGLKQAKGKYIARMDGDDISMPNRFELQVSFLDENPDIAVVGGAMDIINERGERTSHRKYATTPFKARMFALMRSPLAHPTVMMHHRIIDDGFFYDNEFSKAEDLELWLRLMNNGYKISNMSNTILSYRVIGDLSTKRTKEHFKFAYKARKKNFTFRYPIWNVISVLISKFNSILPNKIVSIAYKIENKQNNNH